MGKGCEIVVLLHEALTVKGTGIPTATPYLPVEEEHTVSMKDNQDPGRGDVAGWSDGCSLGEEQQGRPVTLRAEP